MESVSILTEYLESFTYIGLFVLLFLCGLGVPIPEEITLTIGGYLAYQELTRYPQTVFIGIAGVMIGDMALYSIGRRWGTGIVNHHRFHWIFTKKRMVKAQEYLRKYGKRTIFMARFFTGIRAGVYLTAGTLKMDVFDFFIMDFFAALLSIPLLVYLGYYFGKHIDQAVILINKSSHILTALFIAIFAVIILLQFLKRQKNPEA